MMDYIEQERKKQIEIIGKQEEANQNIEKEITTPLDEAQNLSKLDLKMRKKLDKLAKCTPTKKGNISMATKTPKSPNHNETKTSFEIETYSKLRKKQEFLNLIGIYNLSSFTFLQNMNNFK